MIGREKIGVFGWFLSMRFQSILSLPVNYFFVGTIIWGLFMLEGCMEPPAPPPPPRSQLEIRQAQTREYQTKDYKMVMKALLNVLQDQGFIVKNAVVELGLITATKEEPVQPIGSPSSAWDGPLGAMGSILLEGGMGVMSGRRQGSFGWGGTSAMGGAHEPTSKHSIVEASGNVSEFGSSTRVRMNFERKTVDNRGGTLEVTPISDPKFYQEFFSQVDKGIFIQREKL